MKHKNNGILRVVALYMDIGGFLFFVEILGMTVLRLKIIKSTKKHYKKVVVKMKVLL